MKKGVLIGPYFPYRGGIAQHTCLLHRALEKKCDMTAISYKLQYPKVLYPGKEQYDYTNETIKVEGIFSLLNSINPFSWISTAHFILKQKCDFVVIQWWHPFLAPMYIGLMLLLKCFGKMDVILMCHNVLPHEKFPMDRFLFKCLAKLSDGMLFHSSEEREKAMSLAHIKKSICFPLPLFNQYIASHLTREESKVALQIQGDSILFFGFIREYKGLDVLIKAMERVHKTLPDLKLIIAGEFFNNKEIYLRQIQEAGIADSIKIFDEFIPDQEVSKFFKASELVVLPYHSATQSGIVATAYGNDRPVVVTDIKGLTEVVEKDKTGFIIPINDDKRLAEVIIDFYKRNRFDEMQKEVAVYKERLSWDEFMHKIDEMLESR